jgi:DNA adenine methylase
VILRAPFPWFGGKRRVADLVWERFGDVPNYVEPFAGSLAVLLGRPHEARTETVNDLDCYVANFWRALQAAPDEVAAWADAPVNEADLHARHQWLVDREGFRERMKADPDHYDAKVAGWWVWGISQWIGSGWCRNPQQRGRSGAGLTCDKGVHARTQWNERPFLSHDGQGVHAKRPRLGHGGRGVTRQMPDLHGDSGATGKGVCASGVVNKRSMLCPEGVGVHRTALASSDDDEQLTGIDAWFSDLAARLRRVRVCCGDWSRIMGPSPTTCIGTTAVMLDPPYGVSDRAECYSQDDFTVAKDVHAWAAEHGADPGLRIALCGYVGEHDDLEARGWSVIAWKSSGGYARGGNEKGPNAERERIWFSPHCLTPAVDPAISGQRSLFEALG